MKKYQCPICGKMTEIDETIKKCNNCNTLINKELLNDETGEKKVKLGIAINALNRDFKTILTKTETLKNDLYIEYYKMYASKCLELNYEEDDFFNHIIDISLDEQKTIILHMLEHIDIYNNKKVEEFINKTENNEYYLDILNTIKTLESEKIIEKEIRETHFSKTIIPYTKQIDNNKTEGKAFILLSCLLYVVFILIVLIFTDKDIKYQMFNISFIIPSLILLSGINKLLIKKKNIIISILLFIVIYYVSTLLITIPYQKQEINIFVDHFLGIINTPIDLLMILGERMSS